ncbi:MAG TPA: long-chain fatty acid--CoA ligase [Pyrinomonadaceae bacterium]|jgi:long-chain acyl-CoA synthetase|nr:long-chain fatty acid--CoA ligase [Pyrinomonadaceae bacterium]
MAKPQTLRELLEQRCAEKPDETFLISEADGRRWTYTELDKTVNRTANLLKANGIGKGDVVSLLMPNSAEYIIAYFACFKIGALAGPVNSLLKAEEIRYVVNNSEAKLLLGSADFSLPARETLPTLQNIIMFDDVSAATKDQSDELRGVELSGEDDAIIIYTSGTTGKPKGCLLTHCNLIANARQITEWLCYTEKDRLLTIMPLFHMNAVSVTTMTPLYAGGASVVSPKFSASKFWQIISDYKITSFGSVATMLSMLLQKFPGGVPENFDTAQLRFAMCGSAPVPAEVMKKFEETFNCPVIEGYGLSESTCRSTFNPPDEDRRAGSCGKPIGNEMAVFDEEDRPLPDGELGEIVLRGDNIFKAYFKNEEATEKAFRGGWFHTGDIGYRSPDGFFYIADRKSDMIIRSGENIYPREIDELLFSHPAVSSAAVIGVPDELYGEEVAAFIVLKDGAEVTEDEVINFCRERLADFKCPKSVRFLKDIPKGPTGKLLKRELARMFKENKTSE